MTRQDGHRGHSARLVDGQARWPQWEPGHSINGWLQVQELIGKGGMGVVWRVHHHEWNKDLAVKMPLPAMVNSPTARDRFLREAETWIDLGVHPHIVQCWFVMEFSGLPCLFLDYLAGGSLKAWIDAGYIRPGQWPRILEIAIEVCEGLDYAHSRGVIHRDVKPANLLIRGDERVCVTDFGIVKTAQPEPHATVNSPSFSDFDEAGLTGTGAFLGTPQYGAPEQWGAAEEVDARADIYALGVTLYELCCGRRPFDTDEEPLAPEVLIEHHLATPAPDPRSFYPDIPPSLAKLTLSCLEKSRNLRPQTMADFQQQLSACYQDLTGQPYQSVGSVPSRPSPDILNNRAVSLFSLGKAHEAREVWRKGLRLEAGHPECLYNLTQIDMRAGRFSPKEALRRLQQAKAKYPLALLCIECQQPELALSVLQTLPSEELHLGPVQRAIGDANMYLQQYFAAEKAYRQALTTMPADSASLDRKRLASVGKRRLGHRILFPSRSSVLRLLSPVPNPLPLLLPNSSSLLALNTSSITLWNLDEECIVHRAERVPEAKSVVKAQATTNLLLIEDASAFELWRLPDLTAVGRKNGIVLARTPSLRRLLVQDRRGVYLFDVRETSLQQLTYHSESLTSRQVLGCFDHQGEQLCILLPDGRIAQPNEFGNLCPEEWPPQVDDADDASSIALSSCGTTLYVGHHSGRLQAYNFQEKTKAFDLSFSSPILKIDISSRSSGPLITTDNGFALLTAQGTFQLHGLGPALIDPTRNRCLTFRCDRLELFSLDPFQRLRDWDPPSALVKKLTLGSDGCRAITLDEKNTFDLWEVDEDSRVFERSLLLSPGRDFAAIVSASQQFYSLLAQAKDALNHGQVGASYRTLGRARTVPGYAQAPEALDMTWCLQELLHRGRLDAVWERLDLSSHRSRPYPIALTEDGHHLVRANDSTLEITVDTGSDTQTLWSAECQNEILAVAIDRDGPDRQVIALNNQGLAQRFRLADGSVVSQTSLSRGSLLWASLQGDLCYARTQRGLVGVYALSTSSPLGEMSSSWLPSPTIFVYKGTAILTPTEEGLATIDLSTKKAKLLPTPKLTSHREKHPCFARYHAPSSLLLLGYEDGSIIVCDDERLMPLLVLPQFARDQITDVQLVVSLSLGIAATHTGQVLFFDLSTGEHLGEFSAAHTAIPYLSLSTSGRYLATTAASGSVRVWETSWLAHQDEQDQPPKRPAESTTLSKLSSFLRLKTRSH